MIQLKRNEIVCSDVLEYLKGLPDESVNCVITSPPYWGLRDYGTGEWVGGSPDCDHTDDDFGHRTKSSKQLSSNGTQFAQYTDTCAKCGAKRVDNQLGLEPTLKEFIEKLVIIFREVRRVLRKDGTCFINMGDSYAASVNGRSAAATKELGSDDRTFRDKPFSTVGEGIKPKDLCGQPWRLAFALQDDGWWLRQDIIWCLSGGTYVYARTQKGDMPMMIRDMARLKPGTVQLWNGEKWTKILGYSKAKRKGTELELVLRSGERIACTPTHQFPTQRGLLPASDLLIGDILNRTTIPAPEYPLIPQHIGLDAAWFAGLYIAEGSKSDDCIQIAGHIKESVRWERLKTIAESYGGSITRTIDGNQMNIRMHGKMLLAILDMLVSGRTAHDKGINPVAWRYSNEFLRELLDGYLSGDGHYDTSNDRWRLGFARNYNLERDFRTLAARLGFKLTLNLSSVKYGDGSKPTFRGEIRFNRSTHGNNSDMGEIVEIRKSRCREVYDIGVEDEPHLFALASGVLTHNCKPNPMPESVNDRCTKAHEYVFLLTKSPRYWFDSEAIRETTKEESHARAARGVGGEHKNTAPHVPGKNAHSMHAARVNGDAYPMPAKANKRSVWTIPTEPNRYAHFATFPKALTRPMILAGCPEKCCAVCGKPWIREVIESDEYKQLKANRAGNDDYMSGGLLEGSRYASKTPGLSRDTIDLGLKPGCECNGETLPGIVLDIFMGSGTTALVARELGRDYVGCELNPDYIAIANERLREPFEPHYVQKPDKPLKRERVEFNGEVYEQTTLFDFLD